MNKKRYIAFFDGASSGNPGPAGIGGLIINPEGQIVSEISEPIGVATNNEAEYKALIAVAEKLVHLGATNALIKGDSQLVVCQVNGEWKINHRHLFDLCAKAESILANIPNWSLSWVPREKNKDADALSTKAIAGSAQPKTPFTGQLTQVEENIYLAHGTGIYAVDTKHNACTCPAFTTGKARPCKHLMAAEAFAQEKLAAC